MKPIHPILATSTSTAKNKKQLAEEMGLSLRTFQRRLKEIDLQVPRGLLAPEIQIEIFNKLGWHEMARNGTSWREKLR